MFDAIIEAHRAQKKSTQYMIEREIETTKVINDATIQFFQSNHPEIISADPAIENWEYACLYDLLTKRPKLAKELFGYLDTKNAQYVWNVYGLRDRHQPYSNYDIRFKNVFPYGSNGFEDLVKSYKESHGQNAEYYALDIASPVTSFLDQLKPDKGIAVTLTQPPIIHQYPQGLNNLYDLFGDIYEPKTWEKILQKMEELEIADKGFNLITINPVAGQQTQEDIYGFLWDLNILMKAYRVLNKDGGMIFIRHSRPDRSQIGEHDIEKYFQSLEAENIEVNYYPGNHTFCITKRVDSPDELPKPNLKELQTA